MASAARKKNNMTEENIEEVFLTSDDILRAAVEDEEIAKLTVNQLKFWLKCRRINQSGNKQALQKVIVSLCVLFFFT